MAELPSGTVTFLFTDLEGSTRLWQEHPGAMRSALARHDEIVRGAIEGRRGRVVKTTGDGFHAAFADPGDAVDAAVAGQLVLGAEDWSATGPLRVRMGVHSGPAELREGDYYGTAVNRAARLMSVAHGGQVVVSLATAELVQDDKVELIDLGEHALRDLSRPERIFQVEYPGLDREFPRLATLNAFAGNLPVHVTSFVGRDDDVTAIVQLIDETKLVTLIGAGGVGKTRLATQVAAEVLPRFHDGAWCCELAPVDDPDGMTQVVASALGCVQRQGMSLAESIVEYLKVRNLLLVLDNCEHLLDDSAGFADAVLRECPGVTVIATSREALDVAGERVVRVRSLDAPDPDATGAEIVYCAAVQLFADRAADVGASTAWNDLQWTAVGEICRRVDGIPLAIELAAARVSAMSPADIAAHLDERFRLLTGKRRGRVERHQTLRATVAWSYQLLADGERAVFDRVGVFAGSFDVPAAVAVAGSDGLDEWSVIDAVASLVAKSMVVMEDGPDDAARYSMLETLRQYARERLDESGGAESWRRRHAAHYASWAAEAEIGLAGRDALLWMARLRADLDNLRAAVGWALDAGDHQDEELGLRTLGPLMAMGGYDNDTGLGQVALRALPVAERHSAELRGPVLTMAGYQALNQGELEQARELLWRALADGLPSSGPNRFHVHQYLWLVELLCGDFDAVREIDRETRATFGSVGSPYVEAMTFSALASFEAIAGWNEQARADAERALQAARRSENPFALANTYHSTAWALLRDDPAGALDAAEHFLDLYRRYAIARGSAGGALALAGGLRALLGDPSGALEYLHDGVVVCRDQGVRLQLAAALDWAIGALVKTGNPEAAATLLAALDTGVLAGVSMFPGVEARRARALDRIRSVVGDDEADRHLARGADMTYDELVAYAIEHLEPPDPNPDDAPDAARTDAPR